MPTARFILGRAGSGKTTTILDEIVALLDADPLGPPIFLLVPDQATLLYERLVAAAAPGGGYLRLQVITFRQLNAWLLDRAGGSAIPEITALGRRILIGRLLRRLEPQLTFYRSTAREPGLAGRLDDAFGELENSGKTDADLRALADEITVAHADSSLPGKLRDLSVLFREYETLLGSDRLDQHRRHRLALDAVDRCDDIASLTLFVDGFYDFNRAERQLMHRLIDRGCATAIALDVDPADAHGDRELLPTDLLRMPTYTFRRLRLAMQRRATPFEVVTLDTQPRFLAQSLLHIAKRFGVHRPGAIADDGAVRFVETIDRAGEAAAAAREILDLLAGGLRMRDVVVLARDVNEYATHVDAAFREHGIAFFIDRQETAAHQPLIRTIRALVQLAMSDWTPDRVTELLKAGLVGVEPDVCDALEQYLVAHRIRGHAAWQEDWRFRRAGMRRGDDDDAAATDAESEDLIAMNAVRRRLAAALAPLMPGGDGTIATSAWCQRLCGSLDALGVNASLAREIAGHDRDGDVEAALRKREVWSEFSELLDQLCTVLSGEPLTLREFSEVMDVALERFVLSIVPPSIDQVLVGSVDRTRSGPVRACILLGMSEGQFPRRQTDVSAFSDDDRQLLEARDVEIGTATRTVLLDELFLAYLAVTRASERLTLIRSCSTEAGAALSASPFWTQARSLVRDVAIARAGPTPRAREIGSARQLIEATLAWSLDDVSTDDVARRTLATWMLRSAEPRIATLREMARRGMNYHNVAALPPSLAAALNPSPLRGSATRFETFAQCPFKHFAQHGLRLTRRQEPEFTRAEVGTLYHRVLERLVRDTIEQRHDLAVPLPDLAERIRSLAWAAATELRDELLLSDGRTQHLIESMERTLADVAHTQQHVLGLGRFRPRGTEFAFGFDEQTPTLAIDTPNGNRVELRGKVDRVDAIAVADRIAAIVIDYKLGGQTINYDRVHYGLSLQLVTYLLVLSSMGEQWMGQPIEPAAAFYVKVSRRIERVGHPSDAAEPNTAAFWETRTTKARGIIDERFVGALDKDMIAGESSTAYAMSLPKNGDGVDLSRHDVLSPIAFAALVNWSRGKLGEIADQIIAGVIAVHPYRDGTITPCSTCDYRPVCRFDTQFNRYLHLEKLGKQRLASIVEIAAKGAS